MPRLAKGGKWIYGWVICGPAGELAIPPQARREFGFRAGGDAFFIRGSRRSGGFGVSTRALLTAARRKTAGAGLRELARGRFEKGWVSLPPAACVRPGTRLLVVRGSRYALGFVARGPIWEKAAPHPGLETFHVSRTARAHAAISSFPLPECPPRRV